jgi:hypothetical protein
MSCKPGDGLLPRGLTILHPYSVPDSTPRRMASDRSLRVARPR